jgi:hypothetical protein
MTDLGGPPERNPDQFPTEVKRLGVEPRLSPEAAGVMVGR